MPTKYPSFGVSESNGYILLIIMFMIPCGLQVYFSVLLMIRDVYTLMLMLVAQVVCVLLGFVVERVMENGMTCSIVQQIEVSTETSDRDQANRLWWVCSFVSAFLHVFMGHSYFPAGKHRTGDENPMCNHRMERSMTRDEGRIPLCVMVTVHPVCLVHAFCTGSTDTKKYIRMLTYADVY